jgi:deoxyribonucleoside regulator
VNEKHHDLLATVASLYYEQDMTQDAIARELGMSRVKVYRLLKEAKQEKIVQIFVDRPVKRDNPLEDALRESFGLSEALVLKTTGENRYQALQRLGKLGALFLEQILQQSLTMAICLGSSTYEVINAIRPDLQANVQVAQAIGSMPHTLHEHDSSALARQLAQKLGGEAIYLSSPAMVDSVEAATVIRSQSQIRRSLTVAREANVALIGIGNLDPATSGFVRAGFTTPAELEDLIAHGAVGDIAWQIYTLDGQLYPCEFNQRVIGLTLDELRQIPTTVAVAMGLEKGRAILGGLRTGVINVLCTDDKTAGKVIELNQNHPA